MVQPCFTFIFSLNEESPVRASIRVHKCEKRDLADLRNYQEIICLPQGSTKERQISKPSSRNPGTANSCINLSKIPIIKNEVGSSHQKATAKYLSEETGAIEKPLSSYIASKTSNLEEHVEGVKERALPNSCGRKKSQSYPWAMLV